MSVKKRKIQTTHGIIRTLLSRANMPYLLVTASILISHFLLRENDLLTFLCFAVLIPIFVYLGFDGRIPVGYALLMLVVSAITLALYRNEALANQFAIYAYWLLVVGVVCLTIEQAREEHKRSDRRV